MKILVLSTWFPFPPDNGSKARTYNLLRYLGDRHTLDIIALSQSSSDHEHLDEVRRFCRRVESFPEPSFNPERKRTWIGFLSPTPRYFLAHHCPEMSELARRWSDEERYDAVIAVTLGAAPYALEVNVPFKALDQHNVESQVIKRQCMNESSSLRRLRFTPTWIKAERFERGLASGFDAITVVSDGERQLMDRLLRNGHEPRVHVIPNGVDPELIEYHAPPREEGVLAFTGALTYQPNRDAAERFCKGILPVVRDQFPDIRVRITGKLDGVDVDELRQIPNVEFTGYVDDIRKVVTSASALVVPLRFGGGTRLKILEAMALGTPVISTPIGAEGLDVVDGVHILLGESDTDLAYQTCRLLVNPALASEIAANARELVRGRYQWPSIAAEFEGVLSRGVSR